MKRIYSFDDGSRLIVIKNPDYVDVFSMTKVFVQNDQIVKSFSFMIWDDMSFRAYTNDDTANLVSFEFPSSDDMYDPLNKLLANKEQIIIDDDNCEYRLQRYVMIKRKNESIVVTFVDNIQSKLMSERYNVFIKNLGPDNRSKMTDCQLKLKIVDFFRDCETIYLGEDYKRVLKP